MPSHLRVVSPAPTSSHIARRHGDQGPDAPHPSRFRIVLEAAAAAVAWVVVMVAVYFALEAGLSLAARFFDGSQP